MSILSTESASTALRVLMLATYFPKPDNPRMGNWALSQAQALSRKGVKIEVVSFTSWVPNVVARTPGARAYAFCPAHYSWDGLEVYYPRWPVYPVMPIRTLSDRAPGPFLQVGWTFARRWLERRIRDFRPDFIFAHHTAVNGYLAERLSNKLSIPFAVTDHDFGEIAMCSSFPMRRSIFERVTQSSASMVAVASRMEQEMRRLFPYAKTVTVHNGTDPIPRELCSNPRPTSLSGKKIIFSCGAFYERKGFPLLIDAFARVAPNHPNAILRIAGDGQEKHNITERIRRHQLENRVQLLGYTPHEQVLQELVWCDVFALFGWDEPFATVFSEACSAGKPIACCDDGGFNDVLVSGVHGLAVRPRDVEKAADALDQILSDDKLREAMGKASYDLFRKRLMWDHNATRMSEIFHKAVS